MDKEKVKDLVTKQLAPLEEFVGGKGYRIFHSINVAETALRIAKGLQSSDTNAKIEVATLTDSRLTLMKMLGIPK